MLYQILYDALYLELKRGLREECGIEISDEWERRVCLGETNVPLNFRLIATWQIRDVKLPLDTGVVITCEEVKSDGSND